jgi:hypothetical protein
MAEDLEAQHLLVLDLVSSLDGPVEEELLWWHVTYGTETERYDALGPRSQRKTPLSTILGELIDMHYLCRSDLGISIPVTTS